MSENGGLSIDDEGHQIEVNPEDIDRLPMKLPGIELAAWSANEQMKPMGDPNILASYFQAHPVLHNELASSLVKAADELKANTHGLGGKKVRTSAVWNLPIFRVLTARAMLMFCKHHRTHAAYVTDRWGNVLEHTDYSAPHSHYESVGSVVYFADLGEGDPGHPLSGAFELMDPRIDFCCSRGKGRPTRGIMPKLANGVMLLFPSEFLHNVHPYYGQRPRLTLAWNINPGKRPAGEQNSMEEQLEGKMGKVESENS